MRLWVHRSHLFTRRSARCRVSCTSSSRRGFHHHSRARQPAARHTSVSLNTTHAVNNSSHHWPCQCSSERTWCCHHLHSHCCPHSATRLNASYSHNRGVPVCWLRTHRLGSYRLRRSLLPAITHRRPRSLVGICHIFVVASLFCRHS